MTAPIRLLLAAFLVTILPAQAAWEELRRNDEQRLAIDPKSFKRKGDEVAFRYLVDFRKTQGKVHGLYRSLRVSAKLNCKARTIALQGSEAYTGSEAKGVALGTIKPTPDEASFRPIEARTSDEDLFARVCAKAVPKK